MPQAMLESCMTSNCYMHVCVEGTCRAIFKTEKMLVCFLSQVVMVIAC